jgi:phage terminase large subunit-like protein
MGPAKPVEVKMEAEHLLCPAAEFFGEGAILAGNREVHFGQCRRVRKHQGFRWQPDEPQVHVNILGDASDYPEWWTGHRFDRAPRIWVVGESNEVVRETLQRLILGDPGYHGTGTIPKDAILEIVPARGTPELVDTIRVRHTSGDSAVIGLKSYSQGRERFQGATLDLVLCDEEPPSDIFHEILTRLNVTGGPLMLTFTPLLGMSEIVRRFLLEPSPRRAVIKMTLDDAAHYDDKQRAEIVAQYPEHMREIRAKGIPQFGAGLIFPVDEKSLLVEAFERPAPSTGGPYCAWSACS